MQDNHWLQVAISCNELLLRNAQKFYDLLGSQPLAPLTQVFYGQFFSVPLRTSNPIQLKHVLYSGYKIEIPVTEQNGNYFLRYSVQGFNSQADLDVLYSALEQIIATTDLICVEW
jgi:isopenicillin-N epimerase